MDVFAHTLWTNALFHIKYAKQRRLRYLAAFFGVVPDLLGFTPLFIYLLVSGEMFDGERLHFLYGTNWTYGFAQDAYLFTHSFVIFLICLLLVTFIGNLILKSKQGPLYKFWVFWPMLGWGLHILIDIPTHPDFYHTPFLYPLSDFRNEHGVSWAHPTFMIMNYSLLIAVYLGLYFYQRRQNAKKHKTRKN